MHIPNKQMNTVWELTWGLYKPLHGYHYTYYIHTYVATAYVTDNRELWDLWHAILSPGMRFHCTSCHKCPILRQWHRRIPELCCYSHTATAHHYHLHLVLDSDKPMPLPYQTARSSCTRWSEDDRNTGTQSVYTYVYCAYGCVGGVSCDDVLCTLMQ